MLDYRLIDSISAQIFYPRPDHSQAGPAALDLEIPVGDGIALGARLHRSPGARVAILLFHGNGEVVGDYDDIAGDYAGAGADLLVVDFRGYGRSGGRPTFSSMVDDARAVCGDLLARRDALALDKPLVVMGRSLGTHCALEIAARFGSELAGLVIESGSGELERIATLAGIDSDDARLREMLAAHEAKLASIELPVLMIHGEHDELIPLGTAETTLARLASPSKALEVIPGAGHNDLCWLGRARYFEALATFVSKIAN